VHDRTRLAVLAALATQRRSHAMTDNVTPMREGEPDPREFMKSGRGQYIIAKALHYAIKHIGSLPPEERPESDREDMLFILNGCYPSAAKLFRQTDGM
jgi:hypothetical protein